MTDTITPYRSSLPAGRDGFAQLLRAEWTKFRTVRSWVIGTVVAALIMVLLGLLTAAGSHSSYNNGPGTPDIIGHPYVPIGPGGEAVTDNFYFVHKGLTGDGSITVRVGPLAGSRFPPGGEVQAGQQRTPTASDPQPWAKAGLIVKENTEQGSAYAAIMVTGGHGVRMQYNYTGDIAGPASAGWLRLTRTGQTLTGYSSTDGAAWTTVGSVRLAGLSQTARAGMFAASPMQKTVNQHLGGGGSVTGGPTMVTATFDTPDLEGNWPDGAWTTTEVGSGLAPPIGRLEQSASALTVTGSGDIAPDTGGVGTGIERALAGAFGALIVIAVLAVLLMTTEYRRGMIRTTLAASPRRGRVLAAKAIVVGVVTFVIGLIGAAVTIAVSVPLLRTNGNFVYPVTWLTGLRVIAGTAALLAVTSVLALALGTVLRRSAAAVAAIIVLVVLPYILATAGVLPAGPSQWLLRLTPAAGFAIQQSMPAYPQVDGTYVPTFGFFPLGPWAGLAVVCGYAAVAMGVAAYLLRRRDV